MEQRHTLWKSGYRVSAALYVDQTGETERALKFTVVDNPRLSFWLPRRAVKFLADGQINLAGWCRLNDFTQGVFDRYASHYGR